MNKRVSTLLLLIEETVPLHGKSTTPQVMHTKENVSRRTAEVFPINTTMLLVSYSVPRSFRKHIFRCKDYVDPTLF